MLPDGSQRELGIPTVLDRLIQQALLQVLQPLIDRLKKRIDDAGVIRLTIPFFSGWDRCCFAFGRLGAEVWGQGKADPDRLLPGLLPLDQIGNC